jgi:ferritin-like metal-binding protein YciE
MKLNTLDALFLNELQDIYNAENQVLKALPKMIKAAKNPQLKTSFEMHLKDTEGQVQRLEQVFEELGQSPKGKTCKGMEGVIAEGEELIHERADDSVRDAGLIVAAQKVEHYEIAAYGSVCTFADLLKKSRIKQLLKENLAQEEATDQKLTQLAKGLVNQEALVS